MTLRRESCLKAEVNQTRKEKSVFALHPFKDFTKPTAASSAEHFHKLGTKTRLEQAAHCGSWEVYLSALRLCQTVNKHSGDDGRSAHSVCTGFARVVAGSFHRREELRATLDTALSRDVAGG